jgi:hypothetical protein
MFSRHVTRNISAYCHGEVSAEEAREFTAHIMACTKCRTRFEEIKRGIEFAEQLPGVFAPDSLWRNLETNLGDSLVETPTGFRFGYWQTRVAAAAVLLLVAMAGVWWMRSDKQPPPSINSWEVARLDGTIQIDSAGVKDKGRLGIGQWLETGSNSRAEISVSSIGKVELESNTRVRLVETQPTEHRLELVRGKLSALIWAPPRLFFVDTPSAVAADLGCAYTLEVDEHGASLLRVTTGWVALELNDRESMVPAGAACQTRPGVGPGTPYFEDAAPEFRQSLTKVDFESEFAAKTSALDVMFSHMRPRDTITLWHLLPRVDGVDRVRVFDKIASYAPPPTGVTREGILNLDPHMLDLWRDELEPSWAVTTPIMKKVAQTYWRLKRGVERRVDKLK